MPEGDAIYIVIAVTFFGFIALAWVLLYPVYRFMRNQEDVADEWTPDAVERRIREHHARQRAEAEATDNPPD